MVAQPTRQQRRQQHPAEALPSAAVTAQPQQLLELAEGLETPVQLIYLLTLLGFLVVGAYLVVRQVCGALHSPLIAQALLFLHGCLVLLSNL
jgi:hypothetical protein